MSAHQEIIGTKSRQLDTSFKVKKKYARTNTYYIYFLLLAMWGLGSALHLFAYYSFRPLVAAGMVYSFVFSFLAFTKLGGRYEREIFNRTFVIGWVMAGVAAIYATNFQDPAQIYNDAAGFFNMSTGQSSDLSLIKLQTIYEGALAIKIWGKAYDFFALLGFPRERYIGILINIALVALTSVITLKMTQLVYGHDKYKIKRLTLLFSTCGMFWLFAGTHVRDAFILLAVTALGYAWVQFLFSPGIGIPFLKIVVVNLFALAYMGYLRDDFVLLPVAMAIAAVGALLFAKGSRRQKKIAYVLASVGIIIIMCAIIISNEEIIYILTKGNEGYAELAREQQSANSLGVLLIFNQILLFRLLLGFVYLFIFPIPFWSGFQFESAYSLFKSFNVIFFYFLIPLIFMAISQILRERAIRSANIIFLLLLPLGFGLAIAGTSLETRHFGVFFPFIFLLTLLPDLRSEKNYVKYKRIFGIVLITMCIVHLTWLAIKLAQL